jgi:hypothetical protein
MNRGLLKIDSSKTPCEPCFGRAHTVKYFKVFGSKDYSKKLEKNLRKFDARSDEGILLRYATTKKEYRFYNLMIHKIVESIYVKVDDIKTIGRDR